LGFNGFSVQAQVASIMAKTDIRFIPYFISRILHGIIASILTIILFKPLYINRLSSHAGGIPVSPIETTDSMAALLQSIPPIGPLITIGSILLTYLIMIKKRLSQ